MTLTSHSLLTVGMTSLTDSKEPAFSRIPGRPKGTVGGLEDFAGSSCTPRPVDRRSGSSSRLRNHLLAPFPELFARREVGNYGSHAVPFLSLKDLIRSKETERAKDWDDISYLEEFLDERMHARCVAGEIDVADALAHLRSRRGFDTMTAEGRFSNTASVRAALSLTANPITQAFLLPWAPEAVAQPPVVTIEPLIERKIRSIAPASSLHRTLVEVVRRQYKVFCQNKDRADKQAIVAAQQQRQ